MSIDKLNRLRPKMNVEKSLREILQILKQPHKVYGHGVVSDKDMEKLIGRVENIENQLLDIKDHLGLLSSTDKLNMLKPDATIKKDEFTGKYMESNWIVYMLECNDKSIYTGICKGDLDKRMKEHRDGKGSKYVRSRLPFKLVWHKSGFTSSESLKEEYRIKQLSPEDKRKIWNEEI